jgi:hypothetical protein
MTRKPLPRFGFVFCLKSMRFRSGRGSWGDFAEQGGQRFVRSGQLVAAHDQCPLGVVEPERASEREGVVAS